MAFIKELLLHLVYIIVAIGIITFVVFLIADWIPTIVSNIKWTIKKRKKLYRLYLDIDHIGYNIDYMIKSLRDVFDNQDKLKDKLSEIDRKITQFDNTRVCRLRDDDANIRRLRDIDYMCNSILEHIQPEGQCKSNTNPSKPDQQ